MLEVSVYALRLKVKLRTWNYSIWLIFLIYQTEGIKVHVRNFMFKNKNKCETRPENFIVTRENSGPTFNVSKPNSEAYKRNVYYAGSIEWNNLDAEHRMVNEFVTFKRIQKAWLMNTYKY